VIDIDLCKERGRERTRERKNVVCLNGRSVIEEKQ
jgi:hypothetical protein